MPFSTKAATCVASLAALLLLPQSGMTNPFKPKTPQSSQTENDASTPDSDTAQAYSHSLALSVSGKQGVVGFRLPQAVYLHARSVSLNDVRVFDASGAKVPFALYVPPLPEQVKRDSLPVRVFPIRSNRQHASADGAIDLDLKTSADGTLLSVKTKSAPRSSGAGSASAPLVGLMLDAGEPQQDHATRPLIEALRFGLPAGTTSYSAQVWLEVSDDLKQWDTIGAAELNWLVNSDAQTLASDRLAFPPRGFRYARLTWRNSEPLQFATITAETISQSGDAPLLEQLRLQPETGKQAGDLVYQAGVAIPVEKIGLEFSEQNIVVPATLGSYRELPSRQIGQPTHWAFQALTRATFFQITQADQQRRSGDFTVPTTHLSEWVLRPQTSNVGKPILRLSWQPATLVFVASGTGPYSLAFGRDKAKPAALDVSQVAPGFSGQELSKLEQAQAGALQVRQSAANEASGALAAIASARLRLWILWGVLLLGVAVLAVMGWQLAKQMRA